MNRLRIQHIHEHRYPQTCQYTAQALRLTPRRDGFQRTLNWTLHTRGRRVEQVDAHGNITHLLTLEEAHRHVEVIVTGVVEIDWSEQPLAHDGPLQPLAYLAQTALTPLTPQLTELARDSRPQNGATWEWITRLGRAVRELYPTTTSTQEIAHAFLASSRAAGVPARFVNGYRQSEGERAECIAWVDVWSAPQEGWIALDVDRVEPARSHHCRLAVGRDYLDAAPVRTHRRGESVESLRIRDQ